MFSTIVELTRLLHTNEWSGGEVGGGGAILTRIGRLEEKWTDKKMLDGRRDDRRETVEGNDEA